MKGRDERRVPPEVTGERAFRRAHLRTRCSGRDPHPPAPWEGTPLQPPLEGSIGLVLRGDWELPHLLGRPPPRRPRHPIHVRGPPEPSIFKASHLEIGRGCRETGGLKHQLLAALPCPSPAPNPQCPSPSRPWAISCLSGTYPAGAPGPPPPPGHPTTRLRALHPSPHFPESAL